MKLKTQMTTTATDMLQTLKTITVEQKYTKYEKILKVSENTLQWTMPSIDLSDADFEYFNERICGWVVSQPHNYSQLEYIITHYSASYD